MAEFQLGVPQASAPQAKAVAKAKAKQLKRETETITCTIIGDPTVKAGAELTFEDIRPDWDGKVFTITTVRHQFNKSGYTTSIDAELKV